jgi:hypothetical protein
MIKAEITIGTCYGDAVIPVQVLGKGPRYGTVWVKALNGLQPFTKYSMGGPFQENSSLVSIPNLQDVRVENDFAVTQKEELVQEKEPQDSQSCVPVDWYLEGAYEDRTSID